ncbi:hypothetical protein BDV36DRAFT_271932 [Aspergillus pseudocaelatus]|uniref:Uncharacterized protein n=1 Tax=Aspergillus pseudocaelatus TaxID=1825620 RepID=A0ABQ6W6H5_9EURO|nr:hypothetical protein BDV36DRAFT_271932 [Aspergillus pseudocaelatus]
MSVGHHLPDKYFALDTLGECSPSVVKRKPLNCRTLFDLDPDATYEICSISWYLLAVYLVGVFRKARRV